RVRRRPAENHVEPEYPKTNASFLSIRVTSTSSPIASDTWSRARDPPKPLRGRQSAFSQGDHRQPRPRHPAERARLLLVAFHHLGSSNVGVIGIPAGFTESAPLA